MSTIDKIMGAVGRHGDDCIRDADAASESFEALRDLIAAALADAWQEGATEAQQRMLPCCGGNDASPAEHAMDCQAVPTGERQAVLMTRQQINNLMTQHYPLDSLLRENVDAFEAAVRDVETAVLAANNLEVRRG